MATVMTLIVHCDLQRRIIYLSAEPFTTVQNHLPQRRTIYHSAESFTSAQNHLHQCRIIYYSAELFITVQNHISFYICHIL
jgi:hypothetical protein